MQSILINPCYKIKKDRGKLKSLKAGKRNGYTKVLMPFIALAFTKRLYNCIDFSFFSHNLIIELYHLLYNKQKDTKFFNYQREI